MHLRERKPVKYDVSVDESDGEDIVTVRKNPIYSFGEASYSGTDNSIAARDQEDSLGSDGSAENCRVQVDDEIVIAEDTQHLAHNVAHQCKNESLSNYGDTVCGHPCSENHPSEVDYLQKAVEQSTHRMWCLEQWQTSSEDTESRNDGCQQVEYSGSECLSDFSRGLQGQVDEIEGFRFVYIRRKKPSQDNAKNKQKPIFNEMQWEDFQWSSLEVDKFGPYIGDGDNRPVMSKVWTIEKILSARNRGTDAAVYCVKLSGKSYRNVAYVPESLLIRDYSQLLRCFLRRMDDLKRLDGNIGEKLDGPAFDPQYNLIDRVLGSEQRGRKKYFLVKWKGLPYSESTWEAEDTLAGDKDAIQRYMLLSTNGAPSSNSMAFKDGRILRDYQKNGLAWMDHNYKNQVNCILADEMGLGKTIQSVSMLQNLRVNWKINGPFLVVAPVSTLAHWQREIESLTDMYCLVYAGRTEDRLIMKDYEFYTSDKEEFKFNVLLTGYEILIKDNTFLSKHQWEYIIVDEAHRLKTKQSKTSRTLKVMPVRQGGLLLLTGTPVQNNTKEIFSLLNILDPVQFNSEEEFLAKYGDLKNAEQVRELQENILKPRLLRRMKEDVEKSIPMKEETIIWVELTKDQRLYYKAIYENRMADLLKGSENRNIPNLRNVAMELRKLCNHPFLCDGLEEHLASKHVQVSELERKEEPHKRFCRSSGKMLLLDKLLAMLKDAGRRVLVFSQFTMMLDLLEDYFRAKGYSYERIDGKVRGFQRQAAIDRYSASGSETFVFLLSTRAGGLGITLTAADTCIIYDSDWNPQNDLQAMARCHRIGQTKDVKVYRLITRNTYEQHLFECSSRKYGLDEAILGNNLGSNVDIEHTKNIEALLKRGAYGILKEDGEAEAAAFHDQNIDQILEQRTQKRLIGGRSNNTFSVATFISNPDIPSDEVEENVHIDMDSKNFWQELMPDAYQAALNPERPDVTASTGPRKRTRVNYKEKGVISDVEGSSDDESRADGKKRHAYTRRVKEVDVEDDMKQWSERDLKRLENRLIMLGKGREEQIMVEADLEHYGLEKVQKVAEILIQLFHYFDEKGGDNTTDGEFDSKTKEMNDKYENIINPEVQDPKWPTIPPFVQKALSSQNSILRIQKNASRYLQTLHERDILSKSLSDENFTLVKVPRSKRLPSWWGKTEDLDLLRGALKHGHKEFVKIREDPSLCFSSRMKYSKQTEEALVEQQNHRPVPVGCGTEEVKDDVQEDGWPIDTVLTMRLRKVIEWLPNGLSDREIKRRAAIAEAARKRWWLAKQSQELSLASFQELEDQQKGFVTYLDGCKYEQTDLRPEQCDMESIKSDVLLQNGTNEIQNHNVRKRWKHRANKEDVDGRSVAPKQLKHLDVAKPSVSSCYDGYSRGKEELARYASTEFSDYYGKEMLGTKWTFDGFMPITQGSNTENVCYVKRRFNKRPKVEIGKQKV